MTLASLPVGACAAGAARPPYSLGQETPSQPPSPSLRSYGGDDTAPVLQAMVEALQARRKGHPVNLARIDFSGPPAA